MSDRPPQTKDKFIVRLPDGLRDRVKSAAKSNGRSMNSEIIAILEEKFPTPFADEVKDPGAKFLLDLAAEIRAGNHKPGSAAALQADTYECLAYDLYMRLRSN